MLNSTSTEKTLRQFAALWLLFVTGIGARLVFHHDTAAGLALILLALGVGITGIIAPGRIRPIYTGMIVLTRPIGWVVSHVLLTILYYGLISPIGVFMRIVRRDRLRLKIPICEQASYWVQRQQSDDSSRYLKQF